MVVINQDWHKIEKIRGNCSTPIIEPIHWSLVFASLKPTLRQLALPVHSGFPLWNEIHTFGCPVFHGIGIRLKIHFDSTEYPAFCSQILKLLSLCNHYVIHFIAIIYSPLSLSYMCIRKRFINIPNISDIWIFIETLAYENFEIANMDTVGEWISCKLYESGHWN